MLTTQPQHLLESPLQVAKFSRVAVTDVQSGAERINEPDLALPTGLDQFAQRFGFRRGIKFAPDRAVFQIVFEGIKIRVEFPSGHPVEQLEPFRARPGTSVESFDDTRQEIHVQYHTILGREEPRTNTNEHEFTRMAWDSASFRHALRDRNKHWPAARLP